MSIIVEDGTGVAGAESYITVAYYRDYHTKRGRTISDTDEQIEPLLRLSTDYITGKYALAWAGLPTYPSVQGLAFPRTVKGVAIGVPEGIKKAQAELALIAKTTPLTPSIKRGKKKVKVGPIEVEYDGNSPVATDFVAASLWLGPFLSGRSSMQFKVIRS